MAAKAERALPGLTRALKTRMLKAVKLVQRTCDAFVDIW